MRKRSEAQTETRVSEDEFAGTGERPTKRPAQAEGLAVPIDPVNEQAVLAAALMDGAARAQLVRKVKADHFLVQEHRVLWTAIAALQHRGVEPDRAAIARECSVDPAYLDEVVLLAPTSSGGVAYHVDALLWDKQRALAVEGPIKDMLESIRDPRSAPDRLRALARRVAETLGGHGSGRYLFDPTELARQQAAEVRERMAGRRCYPFGIKGLDYYEDGTRRVLMGAAPGKVTVVTGLSGSGKSTLAVHMALALARQKRRVLFAAWEPGEGMTLELAACISLGWSRSALLAGSLTEEEAVLLEERMHAIGKMVVFMDNPFYRRDGGKPSNERNLDVVEEHIAAARADVFIADLWERCLESDRPEDEKKALFRQQAMLKDLDAHGILLAQQRKDVEQRADKRPTREGIKGSGAWFEVSDNLFGTHRPALWKKVDDNTVEIALLKQRWGQWPLCVEFDWDADRGMISGGRSVDFEHAGEASEIDAAMGKKTFNVKRGKR